MMTEKQQEVFDYYIDEFYKDEEFGVEFSSEEENRYIRKDTVIANMNPDVISEFIELTLNDHSTFGDVINAVESLKKSYTNRVADEIEEAVKDFY